AEPGIDHVRGRPLVGVVTAYRGTIRGVTVGVSSCGGALVSRTRRREPAGTAAQSNAHLRTRRHTGAVAAISDAGDADSSCGAPTVPAAAGLTEDAAGVGGVTSPAPSRFRFANCRVCMIQCDGSRK